MKRGWFGAKRVRDAQVKLTHGDCGDPEALAALLRGARPRGRPLRVPAPGRPQPAVRQRGDGAVQAVLPRPAGTPVEARHQRAEVRAHPGHRGGRQDLPARHVLPDERQLLLRRLLQGGGDHLRVGPGHAQPVRGRVRPPRGQALGDRLSRRRRGGRPLEEDRRRPRRADRAPRQARQLLEHGRPRPGRPVQRDLPRPRPGVRPRRRTGRRRGPVHGVLEPRLHAGGAQRRPVQGGLRRRRPAARAEHRHRARPRAAREHPAGRRQPLRDRRGPPGPDQGRGARGQDVRRRPPGRRTPSRRGRPRAHRPDARQRRGDPGQRGTRVRAPPAAPTCRPQHAAPGGRRARSCPSSSR